MHVLARTCDDLWSLWSSSNLHTSWCKLITLWPQWVNTSCCKLGSVLLKWFFMSVQVYMQSLNMCLKGLFKNKSVPELAESLLLSISQSTPLEAFTMSLFGCNLKLCSVSMADGIALMSALLVASNDSIHRPFVPASLSESCWDVVNMLTMTGIPPFKPSWKKSSQLPFYKYAEKKNSRVENSLGILNLQSFAQNLHTFASIVAVLSEKNDRLLNWICINVHKFAFIFM